jgi:hypothetical protein
MSKESPFFINSANESFKSDHNDQSCDQFVVSYETHYSAYRLFYEQIHNTCINTSIWDWKTASTIQNSSALGNSSAVLVQNCLCLALYLVLVQYTANPTIICKGQSREYPAYLLLCALISSLYRYGNSAASSKKPEIESFVLNLRLK